jgi:DHA1 family multidrug resistance protein-like MFS transporter
MNELIRDAPFGQLLRYITRNRIFKYPEELSNFECPPAYQSAPTGEKETVQRPQADPEQLNELTSTALEHHASHKAGLEKTRSSQSCASMAASETAATDIQIAEVHHSLSHDIEHLQAGEGLPLHIARSESRPVVPTTTKDGITLVDW